jgi:hypothetical protein
MAITIKEDIIEHSGLRFNAIEGAVLQRRFSVTNIPTTNPSGMHWRAMAAVIAKGKGAAPGNNHPDNSSLIAVDYSTEPLARAKDKAWVLVGYRDKGPRVRINGNLLRENTKFDADGKPLKVVYTPPAPKGSKGLELPEVSELPVFIASATVEFEWLTPDKPAALIKKYLSRINAGPWMGSPKHSWLCTSANIRALCMDNGLPGVYQVSMGFAWRGASGPLGLDSWDTVLIYIDPHLRRMPPDIDPRKEGWPERSEGNGWKRVRLLGEADFKDLNLPEAILED